MRPIPDPPLLLVTDRHATLGRDLVDLVSLAVAAGIRWVQLRDKDLSRAERRALLTRLQRELPLPVRIELNGDPQLAAEAGVGVHLSAVDAATWCGAGVIAGISVHSAHEIDLAQQHRPTFLLFGTLFSSSSKPGRLPAGLLGLGEAVERAKPIPLVAIGGIEPEQVTPISSTGAAGIAVRSGILSASDPAQATSRYLATLAAGLFQRRFDVSEPI